MRGKKQHSETLCIHIIDFVIKINSVIWYSKFCFCVVLFRFHSPKWYIFLMFLFFLSCFFSGRDQNNAITMSFFFFHGYAFVSSAISHGRITKSHNNVLSRPKMYLWSHFKERWKAFLLAKTAELYFHVHREKELFWKLTNLHRENFSLCFDTVKMMQCR